MRELLIYGFLPLLGVVLGWLLNQVSTAWRSKVRLCYTLTNTPECELTAKELRTKTSLSDYSIEIYNIGQTPCIIEMLELADGSTTLVDCFLDDSCKVIKPYLCATYRLMEQEVDALEYHCRKRKLEKCAIIAYGLNNKRYCGELDLSSLAFVLDMRANIDVIATP